MAKNKKGRAFWFRMYGNIRSIAEAVPDESAGAALKAVLAYFDTGELPTNLDSLGYALFLSIKPAVDESFADYEEAVEAGRKGSRKRWSQKDSPPIAPLPEIEIEKEIEIDIDTETDAGIPAAPPPPLPRALQRELTFNQRRQAAMERLRGYSP